MDKWADYKRISPQAEKVRTVVAAQARFLNELVCQAIARVTGATEVNPYAYLNRMSKMENAAGMTIYLDGSAILWVGPGQLRETERVSPAADYSHTFDTPYRFLGLTQVTS